MTVRQPSAVYPAPRRAWNGWQLLQLAATISLPFPSGNSWPRAGSAPHSRTVAAKDRSASRFMAAPFEDDDGRNRREDSSDERARAQTLCPSPRSAGRAIMPGTRTTLGGRYGQEDPGRRCRSHWKLHRCIPLARRPRRDARRSVGRAGRDDPQERHLGDRTARSVRGPPEGGAPRRIAANAALLRARVRRHEGPRHGVGGPGGPAAPQGRRLHHRLRKLLARPDRRLRRGRLTLARAGHVEDRRGAVEARPGGARRRKGPGHGARRLPGWRARWADHRARHRGGGDAQGDRRRSGDGQPLGRALVEALRQLHGQPRAGHVRPRLLRDRLERGGPRDHDPPRGGVRAGRAGARLSRAQVQRHHRRAVGDCGPSRHSGFPGSDADADLGGRAQLALLHGARRDQGAPHRDRLHERPRRAAGSRSGRTHARLHGDRRSRPRDRCRHAQARAAEHRGGPAPCGCLTCARGAISLPSGEEASMRSLARSTIAAALLFSTCAFGAHVRVAEAAPDGQMVWAFHVPLAPRWLDPAETESVATPFKTLSALHDALVNPIPAGLNTPCLAESWSVSSDGVGYEFVLRQGARFHNGDPVTAEDVKFSFERYRGGAVKLLKDKVKEVQVVDARRVRFLLKEPWSDFMTFYGTTAAGAGWIVPKKYVESVGEEGFKKAPIGAGPYPVVRFTPGGELGLRAFRGHLGQG